MTVDPEPVPSPRQVAVVGAGPAGLYAAEELVRQDRTEVRVDLFDRLPTPYGLVRYGVAPDHQKIKSIIRQLRRILDHPAIRFLGGVEFGTDVTRRDLLAHYDAVLYAAGASVGRRLGVPGEELPGCCSATDFVAWYSGHPDVTRPPLALDAERVAVVGAGNVALDVARVLTRSPAELERTDMPEPVLAALRGSAVREVVLLARRGPEHARFTAKELRELGALDGVEMAVDSAVLPASDAGAAVGVGGRGLDLDRAVQANLRVLGEFAARGKRGAPAPRRIELRFLARPHRVLGQRRVTGLEIERTERTPDGGAAGTGAYETLRVGAVLHAVGYRSTPLDSLPFDAERGVVANDKGRVQEADGTVCPAEYVSGWLGRGPTGVIGSNRHHSADVVALLLADLETLPVRRSADLAEILARRGRPATDLAGWDRIDAAERRLGAEHGRERTKITSWPALLGLARGGDAPAGPPVPGADDVGTDSGAHAEPASP